jgi:hypothetical protein
MPFKRHLERRFIEELCRIYADEHSWWHALARDADVFIAIRNNAINAYAAGASIARIEWNGGLQLRVHRKFLFFPKSPTGNDPYADLLRAAAMPVEAVTVNDALQYVEHLPEIKAAARRLTGKERSGETELAVSCACVLDVEAAFNSAGDSSDEDVGSVGRVDIVAVNDHGRLTLTEAKLYANAELRSRTEPAVCTQLVEYYNWAQDREADIVRAYIDVHGYRTALGLTPESVPRVVDLDVIPRLLIFGFDGTQRSQLAGLKSNIIAGLRGRIPSFQEMHIKTVGSPSSVRAHHLQ